MKILTNIQEATKSLVCKTHLFLFKKTPGEFTKRFLKNLFFAFFGVSGVTLITFGFNILAVRYLGPVEFGKWNLIGSISEFLIILPLWGLTYACLRYLGAERENREKIIGTCFRTVFFLSLVFFLIYFIFHPILVKFFKIDSHLFFYSLIYAFALIFFYLFQSFFQGLGKLKILSFLLISSALLFVVIISFYLFFVQKFTFEALFWSNFGKLFLIILAGFLIFNKFLLSFNWQTFKKLFPFGSFSMLSVFAGFFSLGNIDNLMINYFLGPAAVGLYAVYYIGFSVFISRILNTFSQVFLPMASGYGDIKELFSRWTIFIKKIFFLILAGNIFLIWLLFQFYGEIFVFDWQLAFLMSLNITLYGFLMILGNIIVSVGIRGAKIGVVFAFVSAIINVVLNFILIPRFGLFGAVAASLAATSTIMILAIWFIKIKLIKDERN